MSIFDTRKHSLTYTAMNLCYDRKGPDTIYGGTAVHAMWRGGGSLVSTAALSGPHAWQCAGGLLVGTDRSRGHNPQMSAFNRGSKYRLQRDSAPFCDTFQGMCVKYIITYMGRQNVLPFMIRFAFQQHVLVVRGH